MLQVLSHVTCKTLITYFLWSINHTGNPHRSGKTSFKRSSLSSNRPFTSLPLRDKNALNSLGTGTSLPFRPLMTYPHRPPGAAVPWPAPTPRAAAARRPWARAAPAAQGRRGPGGAAPKGSRHRSDGPRCLRGGGAGWSWRELGRWEEERFWADDQGGAGSMRVFSG